MVSASNLLLDISIIIIIATFFAYIARFFKQPLIPAYIITGLIIGPIGLGLIKDISIITSLSEIGIAFLLFIVGLEIDLKKLKTVGLVSLLGGTIQVILTSILGFIIALSLNFDQITSIYFGLVVAFSSTMIVVKLLSDKNEVDTLHGRIIIGILLIQDVLVILALSILNTLDFLSTKVILVAILKGIFLLLITTFIGKFILPRIFKFAAKSGELLFLSATTTLFLFAIIANLTNFSIAIGAFLAGVALAGLPYHYDIKGKVRPLRDFFATIFFVSLGMQLILISTETIKSLIWLLLLVIILKPLIIMIIISLFGYEKRTSFLTSISLAQVSEFSLIMATVGFYELNQISRESFTLIVFLTILTIVLTSYLIKHDSKIYRRFIPLLIIFEKISMGKKKLEYFKKKDELDIVLFGCHRMGSIFLEALKKMNKKLLVIDYNPIRIHQLIKDRIPCIYGDSTNIEILDRVNLKHAKIAISTIHGLENNLFLIKYLKNTNKRIIIFVTSDQIRDALDLYEAGADYVIIPSISTAEAIANLLKKISRDNKTLSELRNKHIRHLLNLELMAY